MYNSYLCMCLRVVLDMVCLCWSCAPGLRPEVKLIPNGCDVLLHRRPLPGLKDSHCFKLSPPGPL